MPSAGGGSTILSSDQIVDDIVTSADIKDGEIANADIAAGAAIAKSKLGALGIVNADVAAGAAIDTSKITGDVETAGNQSVGGVKTFTSDPVIPDEAYGAGWDGVLEPPTKNAVFDEIQTLGADWTTIKKTSDEARTNTDTYANDTDLQFAITSGKGYQVRIRILYTCASGTPDIKFILGISAGNGETSGKHHGIVSDTYATEIHGYFNTKAESATTLNVTGTNLGWYEYDFTIRAMDANGTFSLKWAQGTSNAAATTVKKGSYLEYFEF